MTGVTVGAIAGSVLLIALWAGAVRVRLVPRSARLPLAVVAFVDAWALCFALVKLEYPRWTQLAAAAAAFVGFFIVIIVGQRSLPRGGGGGGGDDGDGGPGRPPPDRPIDGEDPAEPHWWGEFEQDLARYQAVRERELLQER